MIFHNRSVAAIGSVIVNGGKSLVKPKLATLRCEGVPKGRDKNGPGASTRFFQKNCGIFFTEKGGTLPLLSVSAGT